MAKSCNNYLPLKFFIVSFLALGVFAPIVIDVGPTCRDMPFLLCSLFEVLCGSPDMSLKRNHLTLSTVTQINITVLVQLLTKL